MINRCLCLFLIMSAALYAAPSAYALSLDEAKSSGVVGEQADGYLGIVSPAPGAEDLVRQINSQRREEYQRIAKQNKTELSAVEALAGKKAIEKTAAGRYIRLPGGEWRKK